MAATKGKLRSYRTKRDFSRTPEPSGAKDDGGREAGLQFVVQKHAASHLHYDLRLEMGGVMKSWAVPKGPTMDPTVRRLAIEVEDHPMEYNSFEGTIPKGEYGGGTVMIWDRGTYTAEGVADGDAEQVLIAGYRRGKIYFVLEGERLMGSFVLVRTRSDDGKPQWILRKHEDGYARLGSSIVEEEDTSVTTGRSMSEIGSGKKGKRVWHSNRRGRPGAKSGQAGSSSAAPPGFEPMLARSADSLPATGDWTYEPKYDGIRVLAFVTAERVALLTRNGNDKALQFPDVVAHLRSLSAKVELPLVLDGELVGCRSGRFTRFEALQGRMHVTDRNRIPALAKEQPALMVAFDVLLQGKDTLVQRPWSERRERLEALLGKGDSEVRLADTSGDLKEMRRRAGAGGWEGLIAKRTHAPYRPGKRSSDWLKLKIENQQEFVIGGWTEPRGSRQHLGALLLGYYDPEGKLVYAGHTGTGFSRAALEEVGRRLSRLERKTPPFTEEPKTNEPAHWVTPKLVAEVRFNEWTKEGKLRQPVFLGIREDKKAKDVVRESKPLDELPARGTKGKKGVSAGRGAPARDPSSSHPVVGKIRKLAESREHGGTLRLGSGASLGVSSLDKVFFPGSGHTKGDLLAYYASMSEYILPWMEDRPLVLKRFPNGIDGESFFQQTPSEDAPAGVRVETLALEEKEQARLVGGDLATLLYTVQLGAISYDPWHSRVGRLETADYTILDLDPGTGTRFQDVVQVARYVKTELDRLGLHGALKTSGSSGLHVYLPLPAGTPLNAATLIAQIVATRVARRHPKKATVERMRRNRARGTVYVDYLQNILGKSVAGVYAVRAKPGATVSTPLAWDELTGDLDLRDFTIDTVPQRVAERGDLWAAAMREVNDLDALLEAA